MDRGLEVLLGSIDLGMTGMVSLSSQEYRVGAEAELVGMGRRWGNVARRVEKGR